MLCYNMLMNTYRPRGFTIVELLVVIVVIGILALISIVSFSGVNRLAIEASVKSDLANASRQFGVFKVENDDYPDTIICGQPDDATNKCIRTSSDDTEVGFQKSTRNYCIEMTRGDISYYITKDIGPTVGLCPETKLLAAGGSSSCFIGLDDSAYCWGNNQYGEIGDTTSGTNRLAPVPVYKYGNLNGLTIKSITADGFHTCAIASDDNAYCWGYNNDGQIGDTTSSNIRVAPTPVYKDGSLNGLTIKSISTSNGHTCAIASDDNAYCWGKNDNGQIGNNTSGADVLAPAPVYRDGNLNGLTIKSISAGANHTCAIASDNNAYCWGDNTTGQLGDSTSGTDRTAPVPVDNSDKISGLTIKSISSGPNHTCAIASDNNAYCWGYNNKGQIGDNTSGVSRLSPAIVYRTGSLNGLTIKSISAGTTHTCAVASDNNAYCWGNDNNYQLGDDAVSADKLAPTPVERTGLLNNLTVASVEAGDTHSCAFASDGCVYCWGYNNYGQIGDGTTATHRYVPTFVVSLP